MESKNRHHIIQPKGLQGCKRDGMATLLWLWLRGPKGQAYPPNEEERKEKRPWKLSRFTKGSFAASCREDLCY
jgi:hypothetical protein